MSQLLSYTDHSPPRSGEHEPAPQVVVLLHGLFGSGDNLSVIRRHLQKEYRVINIDMPDHGDSPWSSFFSFEHYAQQVLNTLQHLNIENANIIGHSLGGKVAMWLAYLAPLAVNNLIILDIAPVAYTPRHNEVMKALRAVSLTSISSRKDAQASMSPFINDAGTQAFLLKSLYEKDGAWHWRFNLDVLERDYAQLIDWTLTAEIVFKRPVLFIKGDESDYILAAHQPSIMKQFPQAKAKIVNAGHWLHAQKPQVVNSLITKHLRGE